MKKLKTPILLYIFIFIIWFFYRSIKPAPSLWIDNFVAKPILWLIPTFFVISKTEKVSLSSVGISKQHMLKFSLIGTIAGIIFFMYLKIFGLFLHFPFQTKPQLNFTGGLESLIFGIATAITEEIVFRGYLQARIGKALKSNFWGISISTPLYALIHIPIGIFIYHYNLQKLFYYEIYLIEVSILYALHFMYSKNLTSAIAAHSTIDFLSDLIV